MGSESQLVTPLSIQPIDTEYASQFHALCVLGAAAAAGRDINVVAIARNACPHLRNTLGLIDTIRPWFRTLRLYVFENDSVDDTATVLDEYAGRHGDTTVVEHDSLGRADMRGWEPDRTKFLAEYRNRCLDFVAGNEEWRLAPWTVVLDVDPHGGFLPVGVVNSIGWLEDPAYHYAAGMASYSIIRLTAEDGQHWFAHYDAYAARPVSWWRDRRHEIGMGWFQGMMMPIGADPMPMNSAFGGLCVYRTEVLLGSRYAGGDCEHVALHRQMAGDGWRMFLNPGSVYAAVLG